MAVPRNSNLPQHSYGSGAHYGELPLSAFPSGTTGDIFYNSGSNWQVVSLSAVASIGSGSSTIGVVTPSGATVEIFSSASGRRYYAFPWVGQSQDGWWHGFAYRATDHDTTHDGSIVGKSASTFAGLASATEYELLAAPGGGVESRFGGCALIRTDGTGLIAYNEFNGTNSLAARPTYVQPLEWDGATWTLGTRVQVTGHGFSTVVIEGGSMVEMPDGEIALGIYGTNGSDEISKVAFLDGTTLATNSVTTIGSVAGTDYAEPFLTPRIGGGLFAMLRGDDITSTDFVETSDPTGHAGWSAPAVAFSADSMPTHIQLPSRIRLHVGRADPNGDTIYQTQNPGEAWSGESDVYTTGLRNLYAGLAMDGETTVRCLFGVEISTTIATVRSETFTDTSTVSQDGRVQVTVSDDLAEYLEDKIVAGSNVTVTREQVNGVERLRIASAAGGATDLEDLTDVSLTSPAEGDMLRHDGTDWVNTPGRWEVVVSGTAPPVAVTNEAEDDWLYAWSAT